MTVEAEVIYDDRIGLWRVDLYVYDGGDWIHEEDGGSFRGKKDAERKAKKMAAGGSVYLEDKSGSFEKRYPA